MATQIKLRSNVVPKSVKATRSYASIIDALNKDIPDNVNLIYEAMNCWSSLQDFRDRRRRARLYYRGKQWSEMIVIHNGDGTQTVQSEESYIQSQGKIPFKQNIIRQLIRNLIGQYRMNPTDSIVVSRDRAKSMAGDMLSVALGSALDNNHCKELDSRLVEEFLLSGAAISKTTYKYLDEKNLEDVFIQNVNPNRVFLNTDVEDVRLIDLRICGEVHDVPIEAIVSSFCKTSSQELAIRDIYGKSRDRNMYETVYGKGLSADQLDSLNFLIPNNAALCRVIEVWKEELEWRLYVHDYNNGKFYIADKNVTETQIKQENISRIEWGAQNGIPMEEVPLLDWIRKPEKVWKYKYLSPFGHTLGEGETPYEHGSHPYTFLLYPLLDGEVWGLVEDIIDQQRYINRLISLIDFIMGSSAKGVLMIPEDSLGDYTPEEFADQWTKFNGVIVYKPKAGIPEPKQIHGNATNIGAHELLSMQLSLVLQISGVTPAVQGQQAKAGTPSSLYAQEAQNSTMNSRDMFDSFGWFKRRRDQKCVKIIQQFYGDRFISLAGKNFSEVAQNYKPEIASDIDFDMVVTASVDTPVYRQAIEEQLFRLMEAQMIDLEMYLSNSAMPYADNLLAQLKVRKEEAMAAQQQGGIPPQLQAEMEATKATADANSNAQAMELLQQVTGKNG